MTIGDTRPPYYQWDQETWYSRELIPIINLDMKVIDKMGKLLLLSSINFDYKVLCPSFRQPQSWNHFSYNIILFINSIFLIEYLFIFCLFSFL